MARYTFRIHQVSKAKDGIDGWLQSDGLTNENITNIPDALETVPASGKIGTSIPTPLARIYLFKTAYKVLNNAFEKESKNGTGRTPKQFGSYAQLVSDSLDILQLLFEKGNDSKLKFIKWNINSEVSKLKNNSSQSESLLGESFEMAFNTAKAFGPDMTLIEYDGLLLGGLSPFTVAYTSPNLRQALAERRRLGNSDFTSNKHVDFWGVKPVSLKERPREFQEFLFSLTLIHNDMLKDSSSFMDFGRYIHNQLGQYFMSYHENFKKEFEENYKEFENPLKVAGINLRWNNRVPNLENSSHFIMDPTVDEYKKYMKVAPLVLPESFSQSGWNYVDEPWDTNTKILRSMCVDLGTGYKGQQIGARHLPKNGGHNGEESTIRYPWVSSFDFFYDNIIDLGYAINTEKYFNNADSNAKDKAVSFLLPIRREYFLFFRIDDLKKNLKMTAEYEDENDLSSLKKVKVELTIELKGNRSLTLSRIYESQQICDSAVIGLGVFPFYQLDEESGLKNEYSVYMFNGDVNGKTSLKFYEYNSLNEVVTASEHLRSTLPSGKSLVYNLRNDSSDKNKFDFIEVEHYGKENALYSALIIPSLKKYSKDHNRGQANKATLSLDFGTSNTHVAYYNHISKSVEPFSIGKEEMQMVLLNRPSKVPGSDTKINYRDEKSFGRVSDMPKFLREFVPSVIGPENIQGVEYPVKTASLNHKSLYDVADAKIFETVNVGYDINNEQDDKFDGAVFEYATNLKWAAQKERFRTKRTDGITHKRVNAYCEQTLWMLKNMIVNKGYSADGIDMVYFYPASMEDLDRKMFKRAWEGAVNRVFTQCGFSVNLKEPELESVAPYYSLQKMVKGNKLMSYNSINIDIGGGTTDVFIFDKLYRNPETELSECHAYEASVQFAGDNIWGAAECINMPNGFVKYMESQIEGGQIIMDVNLKKKYFLFKKRIKPNQSYYEGDKDMASFFFKYADGFKFADTISNNSHFKKVLLVHYASIIYYVTDVIKYIKKRSPEFEMPSVLTFTGKGSEYIKIIASETETIEQLTYVLFSAFGFSDDEFKHGFKVVYTDNPKILTAQGGVLKYIKDDDIKYNFVKKKKTVNIPNQDDGISRDSVIFEALGEFVLGFEHESTPYANKVLNYKNAVMEHFNDFVDAIYKNRQRINEVLGDVFFEEADVKFIKEKGSESYDTLGQLFENGHNTEDPILKSNMFFLAIANMLVEYSNKSN